MAATVSAWAKPGAWARDSEEHEEELLQQQQQKEEENSRRSEPLADFPSLTAAAATKSKKKKGQTLSLAEFSTGAYRSAAHKIQQKGLTTEDLMELPTGPRQRTAEELDRTRLGGGFRSYGTDSGSGRNRYSNGEDSSNSRWGSSRVSDESRRNSGGGFGRESNRESGPSRADENDDWGAGKKPMSPGSGFERKERGGGGGGFFDSQSSKADESDNWVSNKSFVPSSAEPPRRFGSGGGGGFDRDRRGGFESFPREASNGGGGGGGGADSDTWGRKKEEGIGSGGRPRLLLQPRTVPVSNGKQNGSETMAKPKSSNPFGEARPREEVLAGKGQDWKEIEEKFESAKIKEMGTVPTDGPVLKRGFGSGNGRASLPETRTERNWRKANSVDAVDASAEKIENEFIEEN